ncbi:choline dehydrogenase [Arthrobacter sp. ISL-48]|uniref:choline dehydrogenase n=1 Tax=Arthrobacter sp. ISL-48 TaxID=2819110 RepID=UPI001BEB1321|nr:choline dehydrogenase [Arthrobacter sp. ISL-48]MBT2534398.1 choline dehydrogenase [Arthrobacter sp. ISL-48]
MKLDAYDYIIVGGGSAGCVLANRLSEDPQNRVLVLEAGHRYSSLDVPVRVPAAFLFLMGHPLYDWRTKSEPETGLNGRRIDHYHGRVMGGSSSINGMFYQRANPLVYERWAQETGTEEWDYAHVLPYFKRIETFKGSDPTGAYRGRSGPIPVNQHHHNGSRNPLFGALFEAAKQSGYELVNNVNGYRQEGFSSFDSNIDNGERYNAARTYFAPAKKRKNLDVITGARATRVVFEGTRAVGVEFATRFRKRTIARGAEVILSGGAYNSPQLLQLSGVGNAAELREHGINVVADLPGVGENLQDHLEAFIMFECKQPVSNQSIVKKHTYPMTGLKWLFNRTGPGASNHFEGGGFVRSFDDAPMPNLMLTMLTLGVRNDGTPAETPHAYQINLGPQQPQSKGHIKLRNSGPFEQPVATFNYLSTERDRQEWIDGVRTTRALMNQPAFAAFNGGELSPGPEVQTDKEILDWVSQDAETTYHPCGTCKMGNDDQSVVDPHSFRVHGVEGLRVVDASVMPSIPNANLYAPVMMIAEKAADVILNKDPLPAENVDFYRHTAAKGLSL